MKQWYKSSFTKGILIVLEHVFAVVTIVGIVCLMVYPTLVDNFFSGQQAEKFEDAKGFENQLSIRSQEIVQGIRLSQLLETEGKYNPDLIVDVEEYGNTRNISNENKNGLAYRLGDLENWQMDSSESNQANRLGRDTIIVCKKTDSTYQYFYYNDFETMINNGDLKFVLANDSGDKGGIKSEDILSNLKNGGISEGSNESFNFKGLQDRDGKIQFIDCWNYDGFWIKESAAPTGAENLLEIVNNNSAWNGRLEDAFNSIQNVVTEIEQDLIAYHDWQESWKEGDTNLAYFFVDNETRKVFTNREVYVDYNQMDQSVEQISELGKYVIVKSKLSDFQSNINDIDAEFWRSIIKETSSVTGDFIFAVGIDTKYPIHDSFYSQNKDYEKYASSIQNIGYLAIAGTVLFIIGIVWLTVIAGRNNRDEELHLNWLDRWKTELATAVIIGMWIIPLIGFLGGNGFYVASMSSDTGVYTESISGVGNAGVVPAAIVSGIAAVWTCGMFLIGYLSLVRRLKARTLWKNSVVRALLGFIKTAFSNMHLVWKAALLFVTFVLIHWLAISSLGSSFPMLLMFAAELAAFIYIIRSAIGNHRIKEGLERISAGEVHYQIPLTGLAGDQLMMAKRINAIGEGLDAALEESMKSERLKTDLITNVSHDIKTPLTSIINYIDLLKKENLEDPKIQRYLEVLETKAQRLKTLTEDVVEASKVSSGNISLEFMHLNLVEMIQQTSGEFEEKLKARNLTEVLALPEEDLVIKADGRRMWRILENIYNNAAKYAMEGSRIYADLSGTETTVVFHLKNVSQHSLNISAAELTERFIRGDVSRSTEGSGLGLSIAKSLTTMQGGTFDLYLDGDLFKVSITFPRVIKTE